MAPIQPTRPTPVRANARPGAAASVDGRGRSASPLEAGTPVAPAAPAPRAPRPVAGTLRAAEKMKAERPRRFANPNEYKNYVIKFSGYLAGARAELARAQQELAAVRELKATADAEWRRPLDAAERSLADTDHLYAAPIAEAEAAVAQARQALDDAINPGRRRAAELDAEVAQLGRDAEALERQLGDARTGLAGIDARITAQHQRKAGAEDERRRFANELQALLAKVPAGTTIERRLADARGAAEDAARTRSEAQDALDRAQVRDRRALDELDARARDLADQVASLERQLEDARRVLANNDGAIATEVIRRDQAAGERREADAAIARLEPQASVGAVEGQRQRAQAAEARAKEADVAVERAAERVRRRETLQTAVEVIASAKDQYTAAVSARTSARAEVDARKRDLDAAMAGAAELEAQRGRVHDAERLVGDARQALGRAQEKVRRKDVLASAIEQLESMKSQLDAAVDSRAGYKGHVTRRQHELDQALEAGDPAKVTPARSALAEAQERWADADGKVRAIEGRISALGASPTGIASAISSKRAEAAGLGDAAGELSRAQAALASAEATLAREKAGLDRFADVERRITAAKAAHDEAVRRHGDANGRVEQASTQLARHGATPDNADHVLSQRRSELSALSGAPAELERARAGQADARAAATREDQAYDRLKGLADELTAARGQRERAAREVAAADARIATLTAEKVRSASELPGIESRLAERRRTRDQARGQASDERSRQGASGWLASERQRLDAAAGADERARAHLSGVAALAGEIDRARQGRDAAIRTIGDAAAQATALTGEKAQLPRTIEQLVAQLASKQQARAHATAEAGRERDRRNGDGHPQVVTARGQVDAANGRLEDARKLHATKVAPLRAQVETARKAYAEKTAALQARLDAAGPAVAAAQKGVQDVYTEFEGLRTAIGGWQRTWWKLVHHFDLDAFWAEHGGMLNHA